MNLRLNRIVLRFGLLSLLVLAASPAAAGSIDCTAQALHAKIAQLNASCPAGGETITFNCTGSTILIPEGTAEQRYIRCDGIVFDGEQRDVTLQLDPPCNAGFPDSCPEQGEVRPEWLFRFTADGGTFRNLTMSRFWEGIYADPTATNTVIENSLLVGGCDDVFTSQTGSVNSVLRDNTIKECCDKCLQLRGREVTSTSHPDYDVQLLDNRFESGLNPFHVVEGRVLARGNVILDLHPDPLYDCAGPWFGHETKPEWNPVVYWGDNLIQGCKQGLRVSGSASLVSLGGNTFSGNRTRGVSVENNARAIFHSDRFENNGGFDTAIGHLGGLVVAESAIADAGGGSVTIDGQTFSSIGFNVFVGNRTPTDASVDVSNETASQNTVMAQSNFWQDGDPSDQVVGSVSFEPFLSDDPVEPLPAPEHLHRTDTEN